MQSIQNAHVLALESRKIATSRGVLNAHSGVFNANNSRFVGEDMQLVASGLQNMYTIVLAGKNKPIASQLNIFLGTASEWYQISPSIICST